MLWQPGLDPRAVAGLASRRTYPLQVLLLSDLQHGGQSGRQASGGSVRVRCSSSPFAQFQSDRSVVGAARTLAKNEENIAGLLGGGGVRAR